MSLNSKATVGIYPYTWQNIVRRYKPYGDIIVAGIISGSRPCKRLCEYLEIAHVLPGAPFKTYTRVFPYDVTFAFAFSVEILRR